MNRGDRRELIFKDDLDRERFLETLGEACLKTGWQVQVYCRVSNHFHLVVETPGPNLVAGMKWLLGKEQHHYGEERRQSDEQKAESLIASGLAKAGWTEEDLVQRRKTDPIKLRLAAKLRRETPLTLNWIAGRLQTGTWKNRNRSLYEYRELQQK